MQLIDGKATAAAIKAEIAEEVKEIVAKGGKQPHLAAVLVGHDGGSETYVKNKVLACEACGFKSSLIRYEEDVFGIYWNRRNTDLRFVLNTWQYRKYITTVDFYQPAMWRRGSWVFSIYTRYDRGNHFRQPPMVYGTYRGGRNRGTISFYEGRTIAKPADRHVGTGRSWNTQPSGQGNTHFSQPNNGRPSGNGYQPGTNNRQNNSNTGTRRLGTSSPNNGQPTGVNRQNTNRASQQTTTQQSTRPAGTSNSSGHFGGKR